MVNNNEHQEFEDKLTWNKNIVSLLRFNLNNDEENKKKILGYINKIILKRISFKYDDVQKVSKIKNKNKIDINSKLEVKNNTSNESNNESELINNNDNIESNNYESESKTNILDKNLNNKSIDILFDHILSTFIISDKIETKLDILTLIEEQYEVILGKKEELLENKACWNRYNILFSLFEHIISVNYFCIAKELMNLYEASTILSGSNSINIDTIYETLIKNQKYSISIIIQSQTLLTFTNLAINLDLIKKIPFWFSKLLTILFIICKEDYIYSQKFHEENLYLIENHSYIKKFALECLIEINRNYPFIFYPLMNTNLFDNFQDKNKYILNFIKNNIHSNIWPDYLERHFINDYNSYNNKNVYSNDLSIEFIISVINSIIINYKIDNNLISKLIKEKERFLTYLVTHIMENLKMVSCWSLHIRILFLKNIMKTLSIPSNILESSLIPFSYSSKINILFEISLFIIDDISKESFMNSYHHIVGILNNFLIPNNIRIYSSLWLQFLIFNYESQFFQDNNENNLINIVDSMLVPRWYDSSMLKYSKSLLIIQLKFKNIIKSSDDDFLNILYDSLNTLHEYLIIKPPIGSHSIYLKLLFKISILFGMNPFITDLIYKYSSHNNYQISSTHISNTIQLIHLISIHSTKGENL